MNAYSTTTLRLVLLSCVPALAAAASADQADSLIQDPFTFCATTGDSEVMPDARTGGAFPESLAAAMADQGLIARDAPPPVRRANRWRCMGGSVWVCPLGANLPCGEKADPSREPSEGMIAYCRDNPGAGLPAYVTGRATIYSWECADAKPGVVRQLFTPDDAGYLAEFWYPLKVESK
jgi:hypothetical protein